MNSRKLRVLALLLSAIMIFTAVPSTLFAGEFGDGEVVAWDDNAVVEENETPTDLGFASDIEVADELGFEGFAFEEADVLVQGVMDIDEETWNESTQKVTVKFTDTLTEVGDIKRLEYKDDCTKYYYEATVTHLGESYEIYSTSDQNKSGRPISPSATDVNGATVKGGLFTDSSKSHSWNAGTPFGLTISCTRNSYKLEYECDKCHMKGYMATGTTTVAPVPADATSDDITALKNGAKLIETAGTGHIKPTDASQITVTNLTTTALLTADNDNTDGLTGETVKNLVAGKKLYVNDNVKAGTEKNPQASNSALDTYWVEKSTYKCTKCNQTVTEYAQKSILVRLIAYGGFDNVVKKPGVTLADPTDGKGNTLTYEAFGLTAGPVYAGTDYETDVALFEVDSCARDGSFTEYWYTTEGNQGANGTLKITHTIKHEVKKHTTTKTVYTLASVKVGSTTTGDTAATLGGVFKLSDKNVPVSSLSCKPAVYYEVVICQCANHLNRVLSCTKKTAPGNEDAHQFNEDISKLIEPFKTIDIANKKIVTKSDKTEESKNAPYATITKLVDAFANKKSVNFTNPTYKCNEKGTIDVSYPCAICGKEVNLGTFTVTGPEHDWAWVDIDPKKEATCPEDGFVTQQSQCTFCHIANPNEKIRTATIPKLNHKGIENVKVLYLSIAQAGDIINGRDIGNGTNPALVVNGTVKNVFKTEELNPRAAYDNIAVVDAKAYKICPICGEPVYDSNLKTADVDPFIAAGGFTYKIDSINAVSDNCSNGTIGITVSAKNTLVTPNTTLTASATYDYWKDNNAYQARTQHAPKEMADGSLVCMICSKVIKAAPVATTEVPAESTTKEAPAESTTEETPAESTTKETPAESTTEALDESTTKEVPVEPTTEAPAKMPAQVTGLKVIKNSPTKKVIAVKYNAVDDADQYTVNVREAGTTAWTKNLTDGAVTTYEITGLTRGKAYDIRVAAISKGIAGPRSKHQYRWLEKVTLEKPKKVGEGAVSLTWNAADGASKYKVYYSTDKTFKTGVKTGVVKSNSAIVNELTVGATYYFKVRCYKTIDGITYTGAWSNVKSKIIKK